MSDWTCTWDGSDAARDEIGAHFGVDCVTDKDGNLEIPGVFTVDLGLVVTHYEDGRRACGPAPASASRAVAAFSMGVEAAVSLPVGGIMLWPGSQAPAGWFACDGGALDAEGYPELSAIVGSALPNVAASKGFIYIVRAA